MQCEIQEIGDGRNSHQSLKQCSSAVQREEDCLLKSLVPFKLDHKNYLFMNVKATILGDIHLLI